MRTYKLRELLNKFLKAENEVNFAQQALKDAIIEIRFHDFLQIDYPALSKYLAKKEE